MSATSVTFSANCNDFSTLVSQGKMENKKHVYNGSISTEQWCEVTLAVI